MFVWMFNCSAASHAAVTVGCPAGTRFQPAAVPCFILQACPPAAFIILLAITAAGVRTTSSYKAVAALLWPHAVQYSRRAQPHCHMLGVDCPGSTAAEPAHYPMLQWRAVTMMVLGSQPLATHPDSHPPPCHMLPALHGATQSAATHSRHKRTAQDRQAAVTRRQTLGECCKECCLMLRGVS